MKKRTGVLQTGFIPSEFKPEHYILGGLGKSFPIVRESGDYTDVIPEFEAQSNYLFDTFNCTSFGTLNQIEMYMLAVFGEKVNYSERWLGIISGTNAQKGGNDPHTVYEAIREHGLIPEDMLPYTDDIKTVDEYYSFKGGNEELCKEEGLKWKEKYDFLHKWTSSPNNNLEEKINNLKVSYKISPPALAVYAWIQDERGVYVAVQPENHWTVSSKFSDYIEVVDSYEPYKKNIDQTINLCKSIYIQKKTKVEQIKKENILIRLWNWFMKEKLIYRAFKIFWIENK